MTRKATPVDPLWHCQRRNPRASNRIGAQPPTRTASTHQPRRHTSRAAGRQLVVPSAARRQDERVDHRLSTGLSPRTRSRAALALLMDDPSGRPPSFAHHGGVPDTRDQRHGGMVATAMPYSNGTLHPSLRRTAKPASRSKPSSARTSVESWPGWSRLPTTESLGSNLVWPQGWSRALAGPYDGRP